MIIMGSIAFCVLSAPYTYQNTNTLVKLAHTALDKGHEVVGIFFFADGVFNVNKYIKVEGGSMHIPDELRKLEERGVPLAICSACANYRGITPENKLDGVEIAGVALFSEYFEDADRVVVFGM